MPRATKQTDATKKRAAPQRSNSTKVSALNMMKSGISPTEVSQSLNIPRNTLYDWRKASIESGNWIGGGGDKYVYFLSY